MNIWYKLEQESARNNISTSVLARYLIDYKGDYNSLSVKKLCYEAKVSYSTPTRLAQKIGFAGFGELKYSLATESQKSKSVILRGETLNINEYKLKLNEALDNSLKLITESDIEYIARNLIKYERIKIYGVGQSHQVGIQLQSNLIRFNKIPICPNSESEIYTSSRLATSEDLVIGISYSGNTKTVMEPLQHCYQNGVKTFFFTSNSDYKNKFSKTFQLSFIENEVSNYSMISKLIMSILLDFIYLKMMELKPEYRIYLEKTSIKK